MRLQITLLFLLLPLSLLAQTAGEDSTHAIDEVVVVSRLTQREVIPSQQLKGETLQRLSAQSIADALRYFAGLQLKDYGGVGGIKTVDIRSMGTNHLGVFYDGIELGNAQNGQIDLGQFSLDNVDEITLYNGQKSAIFQPASDFGNAGSVYIRTRRPRFGPGKAYNLRLNAKYGSGDLFNVSTLWEHRLSPAVSVSVNGAFLSSSGRYRFRYRRVTPMGQVAYDTTAVRQNGDIHAERLEANLHGIISRGYWNAKAYLYNSERGIPGAIVNNVWRRGERQADVNSFFQARFQKDLSDRFSTQWLAKYAYYRTHYINRDTTQLPVDNRYWQQEVYLSTANVCELMRNWSMSLSYDFRWNKLNADTYRFVFPTRFSHLVSLAMALDAHRVRLQGSVLATFVHDILHPRQPMTGGSSGKTLTKLTPALFVDVPLLRPRHSASASLDLRAFVKRSFRMPTFNDLYYTDFGNSGLRPESATQYNLGIVFRRERRQGLLRSWDIQADGYYNTVHDKIIAYPKGQQFRWTMLNLGRVHITGLDVSAAMMLQPFRGLSLSCRLQYTYQDARDVSDPATPYYRDQIPYIPYNSGSAVVSASYMGWSFNYSCIYTGHRYNGQENIRYNHAEPWYTHDVSLQYRFHLGKASLKALVEVNNLLNQQYDVILNYPMPGRNGKIGVEMEI